MRRRLGRPGRVAARQHGGVAEEADAHAVPLEDHRRAGGVDVGARPDQRDPGLPGRVDRVEHRLLAAVHGVVARERHEVESVIAQQRGARTGVKGRAIPQRPAEPGVQPRAHPGWTAAPPAART